MYFSTNMTELRRVVSSTKIPHKWGRRGNAWRCSECGALAAEFDDDGVPDPYGSCIIINDSVCVEATCQEVLVSRIMRD